MKVDVDVTQEMISNATVGFMENGYSEWCDTVKCLHHSAILDTDEDHNWYAIPRLFNETLQLSVSYDGPEDEEGSFASTKFIGIEDIHKGLQLMAEKNFYQFSQLVTENDDAITHDVLWQFIVFGEEVYG